ncbi:MAG: PEP-CTERM sorting domain-containing protein [Verrucomicrobia bacterium]|jgi:hypothetical protein|nr:PEP-CTERM sorting domain-containing protein [Verrucomicrobiota bacterium]
MKKTLITSTLVGIFAATSASFGQLVDPDLTGGVTQSNDIDQRLAVGNVDDGWYISSALGSGIYDATNNLFELRGGSTFEDSTDRTTFDRGFGQAFTPNSTDDFSFEIEISNFVGDATDTIQFSVLLYDTENNSQFDNLVLTTGETDAGNGASANVDFLGQFDTNILTGTTGTLSTGTIGTIDSNSQTVTAVFFPVSSNLGFEQGVDVGSVSAAAIPEPSSFALLVGLLGLGWVALRRRS